VPLVKTLQARHPHWQWIITTTTPTGSERVKAVFGGSVFHVYAPYDLPLFLAGFLRRTNPSLYIVMETELWPNSLHSCRSRNIPTLVANARLSEKSARGYAKLSSLTHSMLANINVIAVQQHADAERFIKLGFPEKRLCITGSIKFDLTLDDALRERASNLRTLWSLNGLRPIWLAASTHHGEDAIILDAFTELKKIFPAILLVISPRHPERFNAVTTQCEQQWHTVRHSSQLPITADTDIIVGDTMGELLMFYGTADMAFVGGSLVASGGHNMIEPAAWACPIITGPSFFNFSEVVAVLRKNQAITIVHTNHDLVTTISHWLDNVEDARAAGSRAKQVADENRGALEKLCALIESMPTANINL
jgi:3-deoxy-D-manno-octulosonic-acid transferase